jgi:bacterioferritin
VFGVKRQQPSRNDGYEEVEMKGDPKVIETLNSLLGRELTVVSQYMVHAEVCENWGYDKLHEAIQKRAVNEMKHAETLIGRILFLEGTPVVSELEAIHIGADVPKMFANDHEAELDAVKRYNSAIQLSGDAKDYATRGILERILNDEDNHVDDIEEVQDQIAQMGIQMFLSTQGKK